MTNFDRDEEYKLANQAADKPPGEKRKKANISEKLIID